jgi:lysophospholipase L1-like esterase
MRGRTLIEVVVVAGVASGLAVAGVSLRPPPKLVVGTRQWFTSWAQPAEDAAAGGPQVTNAFPDGRAHDQTLREVLTLSLGGQALRIRFTNQYGDAPLRITAAAVAPALGNASIDAGQSRRLTFNSALITTIPPGAQATTDPINVPVGSGQEVAVSFAVFGTSPSPTLHQFAGRTSGISPPGSGDLTARSDGSGFTIHTTAEFWLATAEVLDPAGSAHDVVALGDSQTDPYLLSDGDLTWPELVRRQLEGSPATAGIAMINGGLTGNTVTDVNCDICGEPIMTRVIRDAVDLPGVATAIILAGTNDISRGATATEIVHGLASVAAILHAHGIRAVAMTIPPRREGAFGWKTATMDPVRRSVNGWLRAQKDFDALVDIDPLLADPGHPTRINQTFFRSDGIHLSPEGEARVASALPLALLSRATS